MNKCPKCGQLMIDAARYDPEGTVPLYGSKIEDERLWVCINVDCEDGLHNTEIPNERQGLGCNEGRG